MQLVLIKLEQPGPGRQEAGKTRAPPVGPGARVTPGPLEPPSKAFGPDVCLAWGGQQRSRARVPGARVPALPLSLLLALPLSSSPEPAADIVRNCSPRQSGNMKGCT